MICGRFFARSLALSLAVLLTLPVEAYASTNITDAQQASTAGQQDSQETTKPPATDQNPAAPASPEQQPVPAASQAPQPSSQTTKPLGTAAAPDPRVDGVPASTPSGAAIAPAKQKRVSRFSIRTALVVGAVVAVGIIAGVSLATSSRPN